MTAKIVKINLGAFATMLILGSCTAPSIGGPVQDSIRSFEGVQIGENQKRVENLWGAPEIGDEKYSTRTFKVLKYESGRVFFTVDPDSNQVVSKSRYIDSSERDYDLVALQKKYFPNATWEVYVPCHTRSNQDKILVNRERGYYIATSAQNAAFVSWSTPTIIDLRVKLLFENCPQRQPPNIW